MQHQIHGSQTQHRGIEIKTVEHAVLNMLLMKFKRVTGIAFAAIFPCFDELRCRVSLAQVFHYCHQKASRAASWVANCFRWLRVNKLHHKLDDVVRRAKLAMYAYRGKLAQQILI